MKTTVVIPVLNEAKSIDDLIRALTKQTLLPTEVWFIDGGSTDGTDELITVWIEKRTEINIKLIKKPGANRSVARNLGILMANYEAIALTDAGCIPKKDWLEKITQPFRDDPKTQVVAGFYDPGIKSWFQDSLADYTCTRDWDFDPDTFLPSSRSIAFTKQIWEEVTKYPEELDTCEDLVFAERLKRKAKHWKVVKEAQVVWDQPKNLSELSSKIFGYASGDLDAKYERHVQKIHKAKWRVIVLLCVGVPLLFVNLWFLRAFGIGLFALYLVGTWSKHWRLLKNPLNLLLLPLIQLTVDAALVQALIYHQLSKSYKS